MYFYLSTQVQRLFIGELRKFWQYHPKYGQIVDHIQGKYSFRERPQMGIVIKNSSGNHVTLAADNYQGVVHSYIYLAHVEGSPGLSLEWVRENALAIQKNNGVFPSSPGIYNIELCSADGVPSDKEFFVDPLLDKVAEAPIKIDATHYQILAGKYHNNALRLYLMPGNIPLIQGVDFTGDPSTGLLTLATTLQPEEFLSADYRYPGETTGPWEIIPDRALVDPIPGAVLSFGRRVVPGDKLAVVVQKTRQLSALEYGGRWEMSIDFDVIARDVHTQREILDLSCMYLWSIARARLSTMGIEIGQISLGGESEESYDENADDYFYTANFTITVQTDWSVHVPLGIMIRRVDPTSIHTFGNSSAPTTPPLYTKIAGFEEVGATEEAIMQLQLLESMGLKPWDPFYTGKFAGRFGVYGTGETLV